MAITNEGWIVVLTLSFLGLIPFATLSFFVIICFGKIKRVQTMTKQNDISSSNQQFRITDDKQEENLADNMQSIQKSTNHITTMKHCNTQTDNNVINEKQNIIPEYISKELSLELLDTALEKNEKVVDNQNMQLKGLYSSIYQGVPKTSSIIEMHEERMIDDANGKQSSYRITSTSLNRNSILTDKKSAQEISNNFSYESPIHPSDSPHPMTKYNFLQSTRIPTEENSEYTEFTIPEFQTTLSRSLMTEGP